MRSSKACSGSVSRMAYFSRAATRAASESWVPALLRSSYVLPSIVGRPGGGVLMEASYSNVFDGCKSARHSPVRRSPELGRERLHPLAWTYNRDGP